MADKISAKMDMSEWTAALDALKGPVRESLVRRMLVEAGVMLRDVAASNAAVSANKEGKEARGVLARSLYLKYLSEDSSDAVSTYKISWNARKAPHGHLIEFGHWLTHKVYKAANGEWYTLKDQPLDAPRWVAARPFLRPAWDSYRTTALRVAFLRGEKELPLLLAEHVKP
jgi:Bacteriophage protein of unknown function (DUF646).